MATAQNIIDDALEKSDIVGEGQSVPSDTNATALDLLNDMIASWKSKGLDLQLDTLSTGTTIYLDNSDILALKYNLSVLCSENYSLQPLPHVLRRSIELFDDLQGKYLEAGLEEMELPVMFSGGRAYDINTGH